MRINCLKRGGLQLDSPHSRKLDQVDDLVLHDPLSGIEAALPDMATHADRPIDFPGA